MTGLRFESAAGAEFPLSAGLCSGIAILVLLLACQVGVAQVAGARLEGLVRDPSGAVVPAARIVAVNSRTRAEAETFATPEGLFAFPLLQPGIYTLSVEKAGFRTFVLSNLELTIGITLHETIRLEVGDVTDQVTVQAPGERVQATDAQRARAVTLRDIEVLPQLGRGPMSLAVFGPGIQFDPDDPTLSRVNGTRQGSTNSKLDGIDVNDSLTPRLGLSNSANNADSIEEFRIVTSGGKAQYGRNGGGQIELITRSGGSTWHGNAFEYHRNTALNANSFFGNASGLERPAYIQNTFGGSLGGPIRRERTFIFGNFQGRRNVQQVLRNRLVLTPQAKQGLFRWRPAESRETCEYDIVGNDPRRKGIDPKVAAILKLLPDHNNRDIGDGLNTAGFRFNNPSIAAIDDRYDDEFTIKLDHTLASGHRLFFRWTWSHPSFIDVVNGADARFPGQPHGTQGGRRWAYSVGSDWAISPRMINELRVGYKFYTWDFRRPARLPAPMLLSNSWTDPLNPSFASSRKPPVRQVTDSITLVRGNHTFAAGIDLRFTTEGKSSDFGSRSGGPGIWPNVRFATTDGNVPPAVIGPSSGAGEISDTDRRLFENLYNDLLGRMSMVTQTFYSDLERFQPAGTPRVRKHRYHDYSGFFQDDWKLHPRFTLNLGLRYEFFGVPHETSGIQGIVDKAALVNTTAQIKDFTVRRGSRWHNSDFNNFAPRMGFAWDFTGNGKTSLRAGWGVFYDRLIGWTTTAVDAGTPGFSQDVSVYPNSAGTDIRLSDHIPIPQQPAAPVLQPPATRESDLFLFRPNLRTGYVQHYSLAIQRELFRNTVVEAAYVGTRGIKLFMNINVNQPRVYEDFLDAFRELQAFRTSGTPVPASNTLLRIFGSAADAIAGIGESTIGQGALGAAADSLDRIHYARYAEAGVSDFYLRNFPQFDQVIVGTNDGRSYYDSFQLSLRRHAGALKFAASYTFSKSMDNISAEGFGFTSPIDNFDVRLNRARGDYDIPHAFNSSFVYTLPVGKDRLFGRSVPRWADTLIGGWDIGLLAIWQSGRVVTFLSGRATGPNKDSSFANYTGDRNIGAVIRGGNGVYWLNPEEIGRFEYPAAGETGTSGRNAFRGPRYFNVDMSLVKKFRIGGRHAVSFRAEAYNLFNNVNFGAPNADLKTLTTFGRIATSAGKARVFQMALRYEF